MTIAELAKLINEKQQTEVALQQLDRDIKRIEKELNLPSKK